MWQTLVQLGELLAYIVLARGTLAFLGGRWRDGLFATLNVAFIYVLFFSVGDQPVPWKPPGPPDGWAFGAYLALVGGQFLLLRAFAASQRWPHWVAFLAPIAGLVLVRYILPHYFTGGGRINPAHFFGVSYLAFRCSHLAMEVRNGVVPMPGLGQYLGFSLFLPTVPVGPINSYSNHRRGFETPAPDLPIGSALLRILVGMVKYRYLGNLCFQLSYVGLLQDDHYHAWMDLPVAAVFYYLFLYCNFSGFCDMAIGAAGLIGIPVAENFDDPFRSRNIRDFWNRWHITLSTYMRDVVFSPLSKTLARWMSPNHAVAITALAVFLLIGMWHGVGWNFFLFGASHGLGVVVNHYYTIALKKRLGREGFKAYLANRWIHAMAVVFTFCYVAATLLLFANTLPQIREIFSILK